MDGETLKHLILSKRDEVARVLLEQVFNACYRSVVPRSKVKSIAAMLRAIYAQEDKEAAKKKTKAVVAKLRDMRLEKAAKKVEDSVLERLTHMDFPSEHWTRIRSNNAIERLNREIRRRTRLVGTFPDGQSALMLVCARLRYMDDSRWGTRKHLNMKHLDEIDLEVADELVTMA